MRRHTPEKRGSACEGVGTRGRACRAFCPECRSRLAMSRRAAREARMTSRDSLPTTDRNEGVNRDREMRTDYPSV